MILYLATFLQPDALNYFFGSGIGTNIGASIVWGFLAGLNGLFIARKIKAAWARLHGKIDAHNKRQHEHNEWMAQTQAALHREATGHEPPPHPHFDVCE